MIFLCPLQEITRLEQELSEAAEKLVENQKTIQKQQRDLDGFQELEERVGSDLMTNQVMWTNPCRSPL